MNLLMMYRQMLNVDVSEMAQAVAGDPVHAEAQAPSAKAPAGAGTTAPDPEAASTPAHTGAAAEVLTTRRSIQ